VGKLWEGAGGRERGKERDIGVAGAAARALLLLLVLDGREAPIKTITNRPTGHRLGTTGTGRPKYDLYYDRILPFRIRSGRARERDMLSNQERRQPWELSAL
jgi:hypothetical protein